MKRSKFNEEQIIAILREQEAGAKTPRFVVQDQFADERRFRILNVIDDVTKQSLAAVVDASISGRRASRDECPLRHRVGSIPKLLKDG